jgi:hypothetical protein
LYDSPSKESVLYTRDLPVRLAPSFNRPKFSPNASWNPNATTLADNNTITGDPYALFVNTNNTVFAAYGWNARILVWRNASVNPTNIPLPNLHNPGSLFVSSNAEIFVDNDSCDRRVDRWTLNGTQLPSLMFTCEQCQGLFVDIHNNLYCAETYRHQVVRTSLNNPDNTTTVVAGTGCSGWSSSRLSSPRGIFVTDNLDLYVADYWNDRVQFFRRGERDATTVAGQAASGTISLKHPTGVVLDGDGNLFIVDESNHRIVASGPNGYYRCVVGCSGSRGSAANQLNYPQTMSFDTDGNIFVTDRDNRRIQKFFSCNDTCGE